MIIMKSGKRKITEGIELQNKEKIRRFGEKETYTILGNIRRGHYQANADEKIKIKKNNSREQNQTIKILSKG